MFIVSWKGGFGQESDLRGLRFVLGLEGLRIEK